METRRDSIRFAGCFSEQLGRHSLPYVRGSNFVKYEDHSAAAIFRRSYPQTRRAAQTVHSEDAAPMLDGFAVLILLRAACGEHLRFNVIEMQGLLLVDKRRLGVSARLCEHR
jgi:hypothetical protein